MEEELFEGQGRIGIRLEATEISAAPGASVAISIHLYNRGLEDDAFRLSVEGVPLSWVSAASPVVQLATGEQRETSLTVHPPTSLPTSAGRYELTIRAFSQKAPDQVAEAKCTLTVAAFESTGRVGVVLTATEFVVAPGGSLSIPVMLHNRGLAEDFFDLSVRGLPADWVSIPLPVSRLSPGEQREVTFVVQPPDSPVGRAGQYPFTVQVVSQSSPGQVEEVACSLSVAAYQSSGRIGVLLSATEFSITPGESLTIPVVLHNRGIDEDNFQLSVDGIPTTWVSTPSPTTRLSPGQQREAPLTIQPPRSLQSQAGRRPFKIQVSSQMAAYQMAEAECILNIAVFTQFQGELRPQQMEAGEPARVMVENQGNIQQAFSLSWQSLNDELVFEPGQDQELRVAAGQASMLEFRATPRRRPLLGGDRTYGYTTRVQSADRQTRNLSGEVVGRPLVPSWVVPVVLAGIMVIACLWALFLFIDREPGIDPTAPAPAPPTDVVATPAPTDEPQPTDAPPPTDVPPVEPTQEPPPVEPTEEPPSVEHPIAPPPDAPEGGEGVELPCAPAAFPLVFAPLLVLHRKKRANS